MPLLIFKGDQKTKIYRGDGLYCKSANPATCTIDVPLTHALRLLSEHKNWWEISADSKREIEEADKRLAAMKIEGTIKLKWLGNRKQRFYRGDGIYCDAESIKLNVIFVSPKKARQLLIDMPTMWKDIDKVIRKKDLDEETIFPKASAVEPVKAEDVPQRPVIDYKGSGFKQLEKLAKDRGIDLTLISTKAQLIDALMLDDEKAILKPGVKKAEK